METIELKHDYTIMEVYPNILFESISEYDKYLENHSHEETDNYIKQWITNRTIECIEKDLKDGTIKELPKNWKEEYLRKMNKSKVRYGVAFGSWIEYKDEYYYGKQITEELCNLLNTDYEQDELKLETINYFKHKRKFISKVIKKRIKPFLNLEQADELAKERLLKSFPKATDEMIGQFQLDAFAGCYVKDKVMEDLLGLYTQIKNYNDFICNKFLEEE